MKNYDFVLAGFKGSYHFNHDMSKLLHYQCGGPTDILCYPESEDDCLRLVQNCVRYMIPFIVIGKGSNVLLSDGGFRGIMISLDAFAKTIEKVDSHSVYCGASVMLWDLVKFSMENALGDMSAMSWIPGTVGGALFMNAGAFGTEIEQFVEYVDLIGQDGQKYRYDHFECIFAYRSSALQDKVILGAKLNFKEKDPMLMMKNSLDIIEKRQAKQPLDFPSCGSVFKRPPGMYAGTLIEECGLKGYRLGGAKVSEKHSNFILNDAHAKSEDIYQLIKYIQNEVYKKKNVLLERELRFIGFTGD